MASDDLASLLVPQVQGGMSYAQGKIVSWNPDTFENTIQIGGTTTILENLPVVGGTDALSYQPGQYVALHRTDESGERAATQWWIAGRLLIPGGDNAEAVIDFMRGTLARQISAEIFAAQIHPDVVTGVAQRSSTSWGDPQTGDPGPMVQNVPIVTGKAIIFMSANIKFSTEDTATPDRASYGAMGYEISGATSAPPPGVAGGTGAYLEKYDNSDPIDMVAGINGLATLTKIAVEDTLNEGLHDFTAKYIKDASASEPFHCVARSLIVFAF